MAVVIAVQSRLDDVARELEKRGYRVVDMLEASRPGSQVAAFVYTSYHPDIVSSFNSFTQTNDATLADEGDFQLKSATLTMVNVTGMNAVEAADILEERLRHAESKPPSKT